MSSRASAASARRRAQPAAPGTDTAYILGRALHQAGLLVALVLAPVVWGRFDFIGGAITLCCLCLSAAGVLLTRPARLIPRSFRLFTFHWALASLLLISLVSLLFSVSKYASILDVLRLVAGVLVFWLALWWEEFRIQRSEFNIESEAGKVDPATSEKKRPSGAKVNTRYDSPRKPFPLALGIFLPLVIFAAAAFDWRFYLQAEQYRALLGLLLLAVFWLAVLLYRKPDVVGPLHGALAGAVVAAGYGIFDWLLMRIVVGNTSWQTMGTFLTQNPFAGFLGIALLLALAAFWPASGQNNRPRWMAALAVILILICLPFTDSKGTYVAIYVALAVFLVLVSLNTIGSRTKRWAMAAVVVIVLFVLPAGTIIGSSTLRAKATPAFSLQNHSNMFRYLTWKGTMRMAQARPLVGFGPGTFEQGFAPYALAGYTRRAHQNYLETAAELGIPGLVAMLWLIGSAVVGMGVAARRAPTQSARVTAIGALGAVLVLAVHSFFDYDWFIGSIFVYFMLACAIGLSLNRQPEASASPALAGKPWTRRLVGVALVAVVIESVMLGWADREFRTATMGGSPWSAKEHLDRVIALAPTHAVAIWRRATLEPGPDAEKKVQHAISLEPTYYSYWATLGRMRDSRGDAKGAQVAFKEALKRNPQHLSALLALADINLRLAQPAEAYSVYARIVALQNGPVGRYPAIDYQVNTEYAEARYALGTGIVRGVFPGTHAKAMTHFRQALAVLDEYDRKGRGFDKQRQLIGEFDPAKEQRLAALRATTSYRISEILRTRGNQVEADRYRALADQAHPDVASLIVQEDAQWKR